MRKRGDAWRNRLFDAMADMVLVCRDGLVEQANSAAVIALGYPSAAALRGRPLADLLLPECRDVLDRLAAFSESGQQVQMLREDGHPLDVEIREFVTDQGLRIIHAHDITRRLRSAEALVRSEMRFRNLVDKAISFFCVCEGTLIEYINPAGVRMLGAEDDKRLIGRSVTSIIHPDYRGILVEGLAPLADEGAALPVKFLRQDRRPIDVEVAVVTLDEGSFAIQARDITDRVRAAEELRNREELLHGVMDSIAEAVVTADEAGNIVTFNKAAEHLFGYSAAELAVGNVRMFTAEPLRSRHDECMGRYVHLRKPRPLGKPEGQVGQRKDGSTFPVDVTLSELRQGRQRLFTGIIRDITDRMRAEMAQARAQEELERRVAERTAELRSEIAERRRAEEDLRLAAQVIEATSEGVLLADPEFRITDVNPAFTIITGFERAEVIGKRPKFLAHLRRDKEVFARVRDSILRKSHWEGEVWNRRKDGRRYAERIAISAIIDENGGVRQYAALITDITKRKEDEERIRYQANYDALTGLPNRSLFRDRLDQALGLGARMSKKVVLMFIDLDGFKLVNDTMGHDVGDLLLKEAAKRLLECVRSSDTVCRLGGDEFTVILPEVDDEHHAPIVAQRILDALSRPFKLKRQEAFVSASIGITAYPDDADNAGDLLKNADAAMYRAKEQGKANYQYFTSDMNTEVKERLALKNGLSVALERGEFMLHYQPKMGIDPGRLAGVEALMRWRHPELGLVSPVRFIPVLEESGLVVDVGLWILREACGQHVRWREAGLPAIPVAVNLSARQLRDPAFVGLVGSVLRETGVGPEALEIEITESMLMSDHGSVVKVLGQLHDMGLHIAMDDFGTGYSSLSYLRRFPIDTIKIDRSFVSEIATDKDDEAIIRTIINMGHSLRRIVVAEGVETAEQLRILQAYHCHQVQGYYYSPPFPAEAMTAFVERIRGAVR